MKAIFLDLLYSCWNFIPYLVSYFIIGVIVDGILVALDWIEDPEDRGNWSPDDWPTYWIIILWPLFLLFTCIYYLWQGFMKIGKQVITNIANKITSFLDGRKEKKEDKVKREDKDMEDKDMEEEAVRQWKKQDDLERKLLYERLMKEGYGASAEKAKEWEIFYRGKKIEIEQDPRMGMGG